MKKLSFRFLSALLAVLMLVSSASTIVFADGETAADPVANKDWYNDPIAFYDFEGLTDATLKGAENNRVTDSKGNVYHLKADTEVELFADTTDDNGTTVARWTGAGQAAERLGVPEEALEAYKAKNGIPTKIKIELDVYKESGAAYIYLNGNRLALWSSSKYFTLLKSGNTAADYPAGKWRKLTFYLDYTAEKYYFYVDGVFVKDSAMDMTTFNTAENIVMTVNTGTSRMDNFGVYAYKELDLSETNIDDTTKLVSPENAQVVATFNSELATPEKSWVTVTDKNGAAVTDYAVTANGNALTVAFSKNLATDATYTVTFNTNIKSKGGSTLVEAKTKTFKTEPVYRSAYDQKIVDFDFNNVGSSIASGTEGYYVVDGKSVEISDGKATISTSTSAKIGTMSSAYDKYLETHVAPKQVMVEYEMSRTALTSSTGALYLYLNQYDRTSTGNVELMIWSGGNGYIQFRNGGAMSASGQRTTVVTKAEAQAILDAGRMVKIALYFDFNTRKYHIYADGKFEQTYPIPDEITEINQVHFKTGGTATVDNLKIYAVDQFGLVTTSVEDNPTVSPTTKSITATFGKDLGTVTNSMVSIASTDGGVVPGYKVSANGKVLTVTFTNAFTLGKNYTVTFNAGIADQTGATLGTAVTKSFTIASNYSDVDGGFDEVIVSFDAEDYKDAGFIAPTAANYGGPEGQYMISEGKQVPIVKVDDEYGYAAQCSKSVYMGMYQNYMSNKKAYYADGNYPKLVKVEFDFKGSNSSKISVELYAFNDTAGSSKQLARLNSNNTKAYIFTNGSTEASANTSTGIGPNRANGGASWHNLKLYFDFEAGKYHAILDDNADWQKTYDLPTGMTCFRGIQFRGYDASTYAYIDNFTVSTVSAYAKKGFTSGEICEYYTPTSPLGMAFAYVNPDADNAKSLKLIKAQYDANDLLVTTECESITVKAGASVLEKLDYPTTVPTGGYVKYFIWEGFDTMKPVITPKEF